MNKERLKEIKNRSVGMYSYHEGNLIGIDVKPYDYKWLIEQAERAQELEEFNRILSSDKSMFIEELVREQQQNKRYREALMTIAVGDDHFAKYEDIARDALEGEE